jgi:hypothetical protein
MVELRELRTNESDPLSGPGIRTGAIGGNELASVRSLSHREWQSLSNPDSVSAGSLPPEFYLVQGTVGEQARIAQPPSEDALLWIAVEGALAREDQKEARRQAEQVVKGLTEKHGKGSKGLAQGLLDLGILFGSHHQKDVATEFYTQGIDAAKLAIGKKPDKGTSVLLANLHGELAEVQASNQDWKAAVESSKHAAKIYSSVYENEPVRIQRLADFERVESLGSGFMKRMRDNYLIMSFACSKSNDAKGASEAIDCATATMARLNVWRKIDQALLEEFHKPLKFHD